MRLVQQRGQDAQHQVTPLEGPDAGLIEQGPQRRIIGDSGDRDVEPPSDVRTQAAVLLVPLSAMGGRLPVREVVRNLGLVLFGNVAGAVFVAFFLAIETGVIGSAGAQEGTTAAMTYERLVGIAGTKALDESSYQIFLRAVGANWLVCLAVWMSIASGQVSCAIWWAPWSSSPLRTGTST